MKLTKNELVKISKSTTKLQVFNEIADLMKSNNLIKNKSKLVEGFKEREKQGSTALASGFAIPHTVNEEIEEPKIIVLKKAKINNWKTLDGSQVDTVISIIVPKNGRDDHLTILSKLSGKLGNDEFIKQIKTSSATKISDLINEIAIEQNDDNLDAKNDSSNSYDIVAITACPTGIAHTYMAAEKLSEGAKQLNLKIKVETQGQTVQNVLTDDEIKNAKAIILGVDREIDMSRFGGKNIYKTGTKKVIADPVEIINKAIDNKDTELIPTSVTSTGGQSRIAGDGELSLQNFGSRAWKAVMNGVSFMLPFVVFGGIFIALSFLIDTFAGNADVGSGFGTTNSVAAFVNSIGGVSMGLIVPILTAYTMYALIGRQGLLPGFIIGMLAAGNGPIFSEVFGIYTSNGIPDWLFDVNEGFANTASSSGFIGGIAGAFYATVVVVGVSKLLDYLPNSLRGIKQILLLPLIGTAIASVTFWFLNIPLIYLTWGLLALLSIIDNAGLTWMLTLLLAGMMAIDMGGPINKTAYVFGTVMLTTATAGSFDAGYVYMAAVMAGGMVPPIAIAIATLFKRETLWDNDDKEGGITNWIMGASFITEGAIPFTSKYPKSVWPANIIGSAITGLIVGIFGIGVIAPHGGIFVIALVNSYDSGLINLGSQWLAIIMWIAAILIGSMASAAIIITLRNNEYKKITKLLKNTYFK